MESIRISIIMVCYNAVHTIERTIQSVINQAYSNLEYIVIDGKSTDGTVDLIRKYESNISYWISEPDKGVYDAMNKAIRVATGDYLYFIGADDLLQIDLRKINFASYKGKVIYGNVQRTDGVIWKGRFNTYKLMACNICHQSIFYPKEVFSQFSYDTRYKIYADYNLNLRLWAKGYEFVYLPLIICRYSVEGLSKDGDSLFEKERKKNIQRILWLFGFSLLLYTYTGSKL